MNVSDLVEEHNFGVGDFLTSRNNSLLDVSDIVEILDIYVQEMYGKTQRKKFYKKKVEQVEHSLSPSGLKKVNDARKFIRRHVENSNRKLQRLSKIPPISKDPETDNYGFDDGPKDFIRKMQQWGEFPQNDRRYYLHMVFRFYLQEYHKHSVRNGLVIENPSYQYILDVLYPNGCANRFPPEFRRFLIDSSGRTFPTISLPVPMKGSSTQVDYSTNFEEFSHVSSLRRRIQEIVADWKDRGKGYQVYPSYLQKGDVNNKVIRERVCHCRKIKSVKEGLRKLRNVDVSKIESVVHDFPQCLTAYDEYMSHVFGTSGEQLRERMTFFMRNTYREFFRGIFSAKLVDDIYAASGADLDNFVQFHNFCDMQNKNVQIEKENLCRPLLMVLVEVCFLFDAYGNRRLGDEDPSKIIKDCVRDISDTSHVQK